MPQLVYSRGSKALVVTKLTLSGFQSSLVVIVAPEYVRAEPPHSTFESVRRPQDTAPASYFSSHVQADAVGSHCFVCIAVDDDYQARAVFAKYQL